MHCLAGVGKTIGKIISTWNDHLTKSESKNKDAYCFCELPNLILMPFNKLKNVI